MGKIYFITRSYAFDLGKDDSCALLRNAKVETLSENNDVVVVTPNYNTKDIVIENNLINVPYQFSRISSLWEHIGIWEDYLKPWVDNTFEQLKNKVTSEDLLIAVSGGELGCMMLASRLKCVSGCKMIIDFHDPVLGTRIQQEQFGNGFRISREKYLKKYLEQADFIITWGDMYIPCLEEKVSGISGKAKAIYHGYKTRYNKPNNHKISDGPKRIIYGGTMGRFQRIDEAIKLFGNRKDIILELMGDPDRVTRNSAEKYSNVIISPRMQHSDYMEYMVANADIGLVSLVGNGLGIAAPSKIFELINLEVPIFGIIPDGDGSSIINSGYGFAADVSETDKLNEYLKLIVKEDVQKSIREKMHEDKYKWDSQYLMEDYKQTIDMVWHTEPLRE